MWSISIAALCVNREHRQDTIGEPGSRWRYYSPVCHSRQCVDELRHLLQPRRIRQRALPANEIVQHVFRLAGSRGDDGHGGVGGGELEEKLCPGGGIEFHCPIGRLAPGNPVPRSQGSSTFVASGLAAAARKAGETGGSAPRSPSSLQGCDPRSAALPQYRPAEPEQLRRAAVGIVRSPAGPLDQSAAFHLAPEVLLVQAQPGQRLDDAL